MTTPDAGARDAAPSPPPAVDAGACVGIECARIKLGLRRIFVGDTDRGETPASYAWRSIGANVDGLITGYPAHDECKPEATAPQYSPYDGDQGIDNVWGERILPSLAPWDATPTKAQNEAIKRGGRTPVLVLGSLSGGLVESKLDLSLAYVEASPTTPQWNGTDIRTLAQGVTPVVSYPVGTFANGIFESGPADVTVPLELTIGAQPIVVPVRGLRIHFELLPDNTAIGGVLSGAVSVADLTAAVLVHIARTAPDACGSAKVEAVRTTIRQAADVLADGARDKTRICDAISFGVGFDAAPIELRGVAAAIPIAPVTCP